MYICLEPWNNVSSSYMFLALGDFAVFSHDFLVFYIFGFFPPGYLVHHITNMVFVFFSITTLGIQRILG